MGGALFQRGRSGVHPTDLGEFVLVRARSVLLSMDDLLHDVTARGASPSTLRVGGVGQLALDLSARLPELFAGVPVHVRTEYSPKLVTDLVRAGRLDLGATLDYTDRDEPADGPLLRSMLAVEPLHVALWPGHPEAQKPSVSLGDLALDPWALTPPDGTGWPECFYLACQRYGFTPEVPYRLHERSRIRELVSGRKAIAPCQADFDAGPDIVIKPLQDEPVQLRHLLIWRRDSAVHQASDRIARLARQILDSRPRTAQSPEPPHPLTAGNGKRAR